MAPAPSNWIEVTPSEFLWEREALAFIRQRFPSHGVNRAWSNFEFIAQDGSINEVDLLILTTKGFSLVEIKSRPGRVDGDAGTWTWNHEGRRVTDDNPLLLANRKARKLISLLRSQQSARKARLPFLEACVFLSAEGQGLSLPEEVRQHVHCATARVSTASAAGTASWRR